MERNSDAWFSVIIITLFNVSDTLGRYLAGKISLFTSKTILLLSFSRLIFVATFIWIQLKEPPAFIFQSDWFKIFNMLLFAFSNGINSTYWFILIPQKVEEANREKAGLAASFHLLGGIFLGCVFAAFIMNHI
jgi:solute carrier family 29 (equilibrative nucleoside transporter), member 1/2/3